METKVIKGTVLALSPVVHNEIPGMNDTHVEGAANPQRKMTFVLDADNPVAVAGKMRRRFIWIEASSHAITHVVPRLKQVIDGEQDGISKSENWNGGGGYRFFRLGKPLFNMVGFIQNNVQFKDLAAHVWRLVIHEDYLGKADSQLIGVHEGTGYYLLFNGIVGDKNPTGGNVLTHKILQLLPSFDGPKVVYGAACRLGAAHLNKMQIEFRSIPYNIKVS